MTNIEVRPGIFVEVEELVRVALIFRKTMPYATVEQICGEVLAFLAQAGGWEQKT